MMFVSVGLFAMTMMQDFAEAYGKHSHGHVKVKVWRGPSHGYKKHKYAPFGYHFSIDEKGHY